MENYNKQFLFYLTLFYFVMSGYLLEAFSFLTETEKEWLWMEEEVGGTGRSRGMGNYIHIIFYEKIICLIKGKIK